MAKTIVVNEEHASRKALCLYSTKTGKARIRKHLDEIIARLKACFLTLDVFEMPSMEEGQEKAKQSCGVYDVLIVFGGDGTMRNIIQAIVCEKEKPILGYINGGTMSDFGTNFGIKGSHKHALRIIEEGHIKEMDVGKVNDQYFGYVAAVGAYADIPYVVKRKYKKRIGSLAYYVKAVQEGFVPKKIKGVLRYDDKEIPFKTPFLLCLSGKKVGGFHVSPKSKIDDGKLELYVTKPGIFNGLLHYLFFKMRTTCYISNHFSIEIDYKDPWDLDGEAGPIGSVEISCLPKALKIFCLGKIAD